MQKYSETVYSTRQHRPLEESDPHDVSGREPEPLAHLAIQTARISLDRKGRKGKTVTLIQNLVMNATQMEALCKKLKTELGTGGTVKAGHIELQGDHRLQIVERLHKLGWKTKLIG